MFGSLPSPMKAVLYLLTFAAVLGAANSALAQLNNPGFEGRYVPVVSSKPTTTGVIAEGWTDNSDWADVTVHYARDTGNPHSGASCQKVVLSAVRNGEFQLIQELPGQAGHVYTPGIWLRGMRGTRVNLSFSLVGPPYTIFENMPAFLTGQWQFVSVPSHVPKTARVTFMIDTDEPASFCIDDASIDDAVDPIRPDITAEPLLPAFGMHIANYLDSKGPFNLHLEGAFHPVSSPRATITGKIGASWFDNSDWADVTVHYAANTSSPHGGRAAQRLTVSNIASGAIQPAQLVYLRLGETYSAGIWLRGTPGMQVDLTLRRWGPPYTDYAARTVTTTGSWQRVAVRGKVAQSGVSVFMIRVHSTGTLDFDDAQLLDANGQVPDLGLPWPSTPLGAWRFWDQNGTTWAKLEPEKGVWDFTLLDRAVNDAQAHHGQIVLTLGQSPTWASARPNEPSKYGAGAAAEPRDVSDWVDYLRTVAARYRGRIFYYEIWNEPNDNDFYSGSVAKLVELTQLARQTLKQVDARIRIISASPYSVGYLQQYLEAGANRHVDIVGYHIYNAPPEDDGRILADLRTVKERAGLAGKPLWITEGGTGDETTKPWLAPGLLARKYLVEFLYGSRRFFWYAWGPAHSLALATTEADGITPSKAGKALGYLQDWLIGTRLVDTSVDAVGNWVVQLQAATAAAYIVWNPTHLNTWTVPTGFIAKEKHDLLGEVVPVSGQTSFAITSQPVLIVGE